ncbi:hypothetical protein BJX70DRAFT_357214 [Aspergillus crustosus]
MPWIDCLPGLNLIPNCRFDLLSVNLRQLSYQLRELHLECLSVDADFICPLDDEALPIHDMSQITWPYLEKRTLHKQSRVLSSGNFRPNPSFSTVEDEDRA